MPPKNQSSVQIFNNAVKKISESSGTEEENIVSAEEAFLNAQKKSWALQNAEKESIISLRKTLSVIVTVGVFLWMIFVATVIFLVACKIGKAELSDSILLALIGGSTANILGMLTIILIFLFPPKGNNQK